MKNLFHSGKYLAMDMASTFFFLALFALTRNIVLSIALGMALGVAQIAWQLARGRPIDTMQWMSLFLVLATGAATFITHDPRFMMIKPTLIYAVVGVVMLKRGWMSRYLPPIAIETAPDLAVAFGYVWSALMFGSGVLNLVVALTFDPLTWAAFMSIWATASKLALFAVQYTTMRLIGGRRWRARLAPA